MRYTALLSAAVLLSAASARAEVNLPLGTGPGGVGGLRVAAANGVTAQLAAVANAAAGQPGVKITFTKAGEERRFVAVEARHAGSPAGAQALALRYRLALAQGKEPSWAVAVFEKGGGMWYKVGAGVSADTAFAEGRIPLKALRRAAFSEGAATEVEWGKVEKVWLGIVVDGPAQGTLEISQPRFTDAPYRPDKPVRITWKGPEQWSAGKDAAVQATLTTPNEGPDGRLCLKLDFRFPGGRHMYLVPAIAAPPADLDGYKALRFTYKATLPPGIGGLLVMVAERGGAQYFAEPAPPASAEWSTITVPFSQMKHATWTKDANGQLDVTDITGVTIGVHGTAKGEGGPGLVVAADVQFVP